MKKIIKNGEKTLLKKPLKLAFLILAFILSLLGFLTYLSSECYPNPCDRRANIVLMLLFPLYLLYLKLEKYIRRTIDKKWPN